MNQRLRKIHLIQVALQRRGASCSEIKVLLTSIKLLTGSAGLFQEWNEVLDLEGMEVLTLMLGENGEDLCLECLKRVNEEVKSYYQVDASGIEKWIINQKQDEFPKPLKI